MTDMKGRFIILTLVLLFGCSQIKNNEQKLQSESNQEKTNTIQDSSLHNKLDSRFNNSVIPIKLVHFIETNFDSLRIPTKNDYEINYFEDDNRNNNPYYCAGYFNNDSVVDYAVVLIKDSTNHFVFSFHTLKDSFEYFQLSSSPFRSEYGSKRTYAVFDIETEKEREFEGVDTLYRLKTDGIVISKIYESLTFVSVWNDSKRRYDELSFD